MLLQASDVAVSSHAEHLKVDGIIAPAVVGVSAATLLGALFRWAAVRLKACVERSCRVPNARGVGEREHVQRPVTL